MTWHRSAAKLDSATVVVWKKMEEQHEDKQVVNLGTLIVSENENDFGTVRKHYSQRDKNEFSIITIAT